MDVLKVLLIDDEADLGSFLKKRLAMEAPHFSITTLESGPECLEYLKENPVDCIISDYQMPGMDGLELLRTLRDRGDDVPFILLTGQGNENITSEAFNSGASDYFTKDIGFAHFSRIINSVEKAVRKRQAEKEKALAETALNACLNQQKAAALLGQHALASAELGSLFEEAACSAAAALEVEYSQVLELLPDGNALLQVAGQGWKEDYVGQATLGAEYSSQAGYTLLSDSPVLVEDLGTETRFSDSQLLLKYGVISGMSVVIRGKERPFGVLAAHTAKKRAFTEDDISFLETMAVILSDAVIRKQDEKTLQESERQKDEFYEMIIHDIKSPLSAILGYTDILMTESPAGHEPETGELIASIKNSAGKLQSLIENFLTVSQVESGRMKLNFFPVDLQAALREAYSGFEKLFQEKGLKFELVVEEGLERVVLDQRLFQRALSNLLQNAGDYTPRGGKITLKAESAAEGEGAFLRVSVMDSGPGIPEKEQGRIFEKYYRSPEAAGIKGNGLGLSIVKAVAEAHGGRVELESEKGKGSVFRLLLPMALRLMFAA